MQVAQELREFCGEVQIPSGIRLHTCVARVTRMRHRYRRLRRRLDKLADAGRRIHIRIDQFRRDPEP